MTSRINWFSGMEPNVQDLTFFTLTSINAEDKNRTHDFFNFGVVNGLTVFTDSTDNQHLVVSAGTAYDPTGERINVPSVVKGIGYNNTAPNSQVANYTMVARYFEGNDGVIGISPSGTSSYIHILDSYNLVLLKTGVDSLQPNDVRLSGVQVTVQGGTFVFNTGVRDSASAVLGGGTSGGSSGGGGSSTVNNRLKQSFTATGGQTVFTLSNTYTMGVNALDVYVNGAEQVLGISFAETSGNSFTMTYGLTAGDVVDTIITQGAQPAGPPSAHGSSHLQAGSDPIVWPMNYVTGAGPVTLSAGNYFTVVNKTVPDITVVTLPTNPPTSSEFVIKDGKGDASLRPITVTSGNTIDGATNYIIQSNRQSISVVFNSVDYSIF